MQNMAEIIEEFVKEFEIDENKVRITKIGNKYKIVSDRELPVQDFLAIAASLGGKKQNGIQNII